MRHLKLSILLSAIFLMATPTVARAQAACDIANQVLGAIPGSLRDVQYIDGFKITWKGPRFRCRKEPLFEDMERNLEMLCTVLQSMESGTPFSHPALGAMTTHMTDIQGQLGSFSGMTATSQADAETQVDAKMFAIDTSLTALTAIKPETQNNQTRKWVKRRSSCRQGDTSDASTLAEPGDDFENLDSGAPVDTTDEDAQAAADEAAAQADFDNMTSEEQLQAIQDLIADDAAAGEDIDQDLLDQMADLQAEIAAEQAEAAAAAAAAAAAE